jgi:hypothetical protein
MCRAKQRSIDQGWDWYEYPLLWISRDWRIASPWFRGPPTRCPQPGFLPARHHVCLSICCLTLICGVLENVPHGLAGPDSLTGRSQFTSFLKSAANFGKAAAITSYPGKDLLDYPRLLGQDLKSRLTPRRRGQKDNGSRTEHRTSR